MQINWIDSAMNRNAIIRSLQFMRYSCMYSAYIYIGGEPIRQMFTVFHIFHNCMAIFARNRLLWWLFCADLVHNTNASHKRFGWVCFSLAAVLSCLRQTTETNFISCSKIEHRFIDMRTNVFRIIKYVGVRVCVFLCICIWIYVYMSVACIL